MYSVLWQVVVTLLMTGTGMAVCTGTIKNPLRMRLCLLAYLTLGGGALVLVRLQYVSNQEKAAQVANSSLGVDQARNTKAAGNPAPPQPALPAVTNPSSGDQTVPSEHFDLTANLADLHQILLGKRTAESQELAVQNKQLSAIEGQIINPWNYAIDTLATNLSTVAKQNGDHLSISRRPLPAQVSDSATANVIASLKMEANSAWDFEIGISDDLNSPIMNISVADANQRNPIHASIRLGMAPNTLDCQLSVSQNNIFFKNCPIDDYKPTIDHLMGLMIAATADQFPLKGKAAR